MFGDAPVLSTSGGSVVAAASASGGGLWVAGNAETFSRLSLGDAQVASGELWLSYVTAPVTVTVTSLGMVSGQAGGASVTLCRLGLFEASSDDSLTLVARTADDPTIATAAFTTYSRALDTTGGYPAEYTLTAGRRYAFGFLQVAGTPTYARIGGAVNDATAPVLSRKVTGQSDIDTSYAVGALSTHFNAVYMFGT